MALKKFLFFASDSVGPNGWSNALYRNEGAQIEADPAAARLLCIDWVKIMGAEARIGYIRESLDDVKGDGKLTSLIGFTGDPAEPIEQSGSCLLLTCRDSTRRYKKAIYLHGVWDKAIAGGRYVPIPAPTWPAKIADFIARLKADLWGWKRKTGDVPTRVTAVAVVGDNRPQLTLADGVFAGPFDGRTLSVRVRGMTAIPPFRNPIIVQPTAPNVCVVKRQHTNVVNNAGQLLVPTFAFQPIEIADEIRCVTHKVGRPFRPSAGGRRKA